MQGEQEKPGSGTTIPEPQHKAQRLADEALLALVRQGDERAFETLLLRYRRQLRGYCARLGAADAAEDVLQQVMLEAWLALRKGAPVKSFKAWLFAIAHNVCLDTIAATPRAAELRAGEAEPAARTQPALLEPNLADTLTAVAELPLLQREAIVRTALAGESYEQVGHYLGLTAAAVRGLIHRGRATLRSALAALVPPWLVRLIASRSGAAGGVRESLSGIASSASSGSSAGALVKAGVIAAAATAAITTAIPGPAAQSRRHRRASPAGRRAEGHGAEAGLGGSALAARDRGPTASHRRPASGSGGGSHPLRTLEVLSASTAGTGTERPVAQTYGSTAVTRTMIVSQPATVHQAGDVSIVGTVAERETSTVSTTTSAGSGPSPSQPSGVEAGGGSGAGAGGTAGSGSPEAGGSTSGSGESAPASSGSGSGGSGGLVGEAVSTVEKTFATTIEGTLGGLPH